VPLEAAASFEAALRLSPGYLDALRGLGIARARAGQHGAAVRDLEQVLRVVPQDLEALSELAQLLVLAPDAALRDGARAAELARRGNRLAGGADAHFLSPLAGAQAGQGDFAAAVATMDRALRVCGPDAIPRLRRQQDAFAAGRTRADG